VSAELHLADRWYAPLVAPVLPVVTAALEQLEPAHDPWRAPRTGLGGAVVIHVARGFGTRRFRRAGRVAVVALEGYNQRVHTAEPDPRERARWLERDIEWAKRAWQSILEKDEPVLRRVMDRLLGPHAEVCDRALPEAVLFLRAAVAGGVIVGDVPDPVHAALDRHATWLGLAWEANRGTLDAEVWRGALGAVGLSEPFPGDADRIARAHAHRALEALPEVPVRRLFADVLASAPAEAREAHRHPRVWQPLTTPLATRPRAERPATPPRAGTLAAFGQRWQAPLDEALRALATSRSSTLDRATEYLLGQGGKRIRPLVSLAAAGACGGPASRALPIAAALEWLHQGSLVLDDIVDAATLRRGNVPLHAATSEAFAAGVTAIVFARVVRSLHGMHPEIRAQIAGAASALAAGERLELAHTGDAALSLTAYYEIIEAKTARLFSCAAAVGALAVEAERKHVRALARYGREIGLAFQIVDDLLDYVGDREELGKSPGTDLRAGKVTLPWIFLRERATAEERSHLARALGAESELAWVTSSLEARGVPELCRARAEVHVGRALEALSGLPEHEDRAVLTSIAQALVGRTS
jgi:octaprenyl-diphosphate synthase